MHNETHEKKGLKCLISQKFKDAMTFPVVVLVLLLLVYVAFFKRDSVWLETMKSGGTENFEKVQQLYSSETFQKQQSDALDAALKQMGVPANPSEGKTDDTANPSEGKTDDTANPSQTLDNSKISEILKGAYYQGNKDAKIVLIEYSDLLCPFCKRHYNDQTLEKVVAKYPNEVSLVFKNMPLPQLHPTAPVGAKGVICAGKIGGENKYYSYLAEAFKASSFTEDSILEIAKQIGLNAAKFTECTSNPDVEAEINATTQEGNSLFGINGTPGNVVLNRETGKYVVIPGAYPFEKFDEEVTKLLK